ncbi:MAG: UDP-N-acetylmuramate dehydrogenase [Thermodesulfobacteriota bacterium]
MESRDGVDPQTKGTRTEIKGKIFYDVPLADYTSWRIGGPVDYLVFPRDAADLKEVLEWARRDKIPYFILGKGTNILVRDGGFRGMAISLADGFAQLAVIKSLAAEIHLHAGAGLPLGMVIDFCLQKGLTGLEFAAGIPGSIGGAIAMNAGAFGGEIKDVLQAVWVMDAHGNMREDPKEKLSFSYRALRMLPGEIILGGLFRLRPAEITQVQEEVRKIIARRREKQPYDFPSAGSVFRNPQAGPAGRLIEKAGLKGYRIGAAQVSEKHANFIINRGGARAKDVLKLIEVVRDKVWRETGVLLELEIQVMGEDGED